MKQGEVVIIDNLSNSKKEIVKKLSDITTRQINFMKLNKSTLLKK